MKQFIFFTLINLFHFCYTQNAHQQLVNGVFNMEQTYYYENNNLKNYKSILCYFMYKPSSPNSIVFDKTKWVRFNNIKLKYNGQKKIYFKNEKLGNSDSHNDNDDSDDECNNLSFASKQWTVKGQNTIPDMNFMYSGPMPSFSISPQIFHDTLKKSDTLFFTINNLQSVDSILVTIADNQQLNTNCHFVMFKAPNYSNNYYLPPALFSPLISGNAGYLKLSVINYSSQTISENKYLFRSVFTLLKSKIFIN